MTMFWVYAALLTAAALAILVTPLLRSRAKPRAVVSRDASNLTVYRDQLAELDADLATGNIDKEQWESARVDLQRGLLEDAGAGSAPAAAPSGSSRAAAIAVVVAVPLIALGLYMVVGNPRGLDQSVASSGGGPAAPHALTQAQFDDLIQRLVQRLQANPNDAEGWAILARTYSALARYNDAVDAYAKATALFPQNAQLLADYADSLAMAQGQDLKGKPEELIQRALRADGNNLKALALAGTVEFDKQNFAKAAEYWRRILPLLPPDSQMGDSVRASIKEAEDKLGGAPAGSAAIAQAPQAGQMKPAGNAAQAGAGGPRVTGVVKLAPALKARAAPNDTVFVLARPAQGPRMPLAAVRVQVKDLPLKFSFDDSMAMTPTNKLSDYSEVVVAARVSKSGNVMPQPGDLEGESKPVHPGTTGMTIVIAEEVK